MFFRKHLQTAFDVSAGGPGIGHAGVVGGDSAGFAGDRLCHAQHNVVGFAARAHHDRRGDAVVEGAHQPFHIVENAVVQIARVGVEGCRLFADGCNDMRVAMADMEHIVVTIEVLAASGSVSQQPSPLTMCRRSS